MSNPDYTSIYKFKHILNNTNYSLLVSIIEHLMRQKKIKNLKEISKLEVCKEINRRMKAIFEFERVAKLNNNFIALKEIRERINQFYILKKTVSND